jgi:hypothetical protein
MKLLYLYSLFYLTSLTSASILPSNSLSILQPHLFSLEPLPISSLAKRKGGGGKGGGGGGKGGGGSSSSGGSSSGSGGKGGSGSSSGSSSGSGYSFSPSSNTGGRTRSGSGVAPAYAGGMRYAGGAAVPYTAGALSPSRGLTPLFLPVTAFAFLPGLWLFSSLYAYPFGTPYYWAHDGRNVSVNATCLCQQYSECGCDDGTNATAFVQALVNNGTDAPVNTSVVLFLADVNGTGQPAVFVNGTLPNGTTAAGGTDPSNQSEVSAGMRLAISYGGYWVMVATVAVAVWGL